MYEDPKTTPINSPHQQLSQLTGVLERVVAQINSATPRDLQKSLQSLNQVNEQLVRLASQIEKHETERNELRALAEITRVVNSSLEIDAVLRIVMDTIIKLTGAERCFLMLKDETGKLAIRIARNWEQETIDQKEFAISRTIVNRVVELGKPIVTTNAQEDPRFGGQESVIFHNLRAILCVPLKVRDEITGVIYADNRVKSGIFTESERDLLTAFANQAAVAIENAQLFESVRNTLAEVTELKNLMDNVFTSIASGVVTIDDQRRVTLINKSALEIFNLNYEDVIHQPIESILPPITKFISQPIDWVEAHDRPIIGYEFKAQMDHDKDLNLLFNFAPLKDSAGTTHGIAIVVDDLTERRKLEAQRRLFEKMVSPALIDRLDPDKIQLGGERNHITTLFADIRGFTSFSESLPPEQLVTILNQYLAISAEAILREGGTIDKFLGDAIMAWFNAPIPQPDHTLRAVKAAVNMQKAIKAIHSKYPADYHLSFGIGIHFGEAILGLVGTEQRLDYTAIGDSVNTAKRIQENAAPNQILISAEAFSLVKDDVIARPLEPLFAKGKSQPLHVFEILGLRSSMSS